MEETRNCINLVLTVKKYPALYDLNCNDYHNRMVRNKTWKAVAQELNVSAAACKEKWKNLRAGFSRHLRNQNTAGDKSKKPYYMADYMDFLLPYSKQGRRRNESTNDETTVRQDNWNDFEIASDISSNYEKPNRSNHDLTSNVEKVINIENSQEDCMMLRNKGNDRTRLKDETQSITMTTIDRCSANYVTGVKTKNIDESIHDADLLFFKSLLPDMRLMSTHEKRNFKISVLSLIDKILSGKDAPTSSENDTPSIVLETHGNKDGN